jgi:hypothetical protein
MVTLNRIVAVAMVTGPHAARAHWLAARRPLSIPEQRYPESDAAWVQ